MSWFETSGIASLAKSALKEAQKTIDKALDIKDEELIAHNTTATELLPQVIDSNKNMGETRITQSPLRQQASANAIGVSIWGSFSGSFFENSKVDTHPTLKETDETENASTKSEVDSLADDCHDLAERFSRSQLVVRNASDDAENADFETTHETDLKIELLDEKVPVRRRERPTKTNDANRSSVISVESGRNSSESLEILSSPTTPGSELTSPTSVPIGNSDSVEVLGVGSESFGPSQLTDSESLSPFLSPTDTSIELVTPSSEGSPSDLIPAKNNKTSPDSVEIIPEDAYEEDVSIADDSVSYTSISESTAATVMELHRPYLMQMGDSGHSELSISSERGLDIPITRAPSRSGLHLSLGQHELMSKSEIKDNEDEKTTSTVSSNYESEGSGSEKTLMADEPSVSNLLEDAMIEKSSEYSGTLTESSFEDVNVLSTTRGFSPISSEKSTDMVKVGSEQTSGHTSADELETTTSSDIEIISSPNGDSSSTHSRQSPGVKLLHQRCKGDIEVVERETLGKTKGHNRELSEASSQSNNSEELENDKYSKRINELMEVLEKRESKLLTLGRRNAELQEENVELQMQLDTVRLKESTVDLCTVTEEYTQRLSALERKFQQTIREKDILRKQLDAIKQDATLRMSKSEMEDAISEREQIIQELREEGEKLSKQQLTHSNIIKKLRAKEKENDNIIKNQKERIEELSQETERLKRSMTAKEDVERSQIEAIHNLTSENKKLEREVTLQKSQLDDLIQKQDTMKTSLEAARKEVIDTQRTSSELTKRERALANLESEKQLTENHNEQILNQLEDLRHKLKQAEQSYLIREQGLRNENSELLRRLESAELRGEDLSQSLSIATKPLLRQLEALQATCNTRSQAWERQEMILVDKLNEAQSRVGSLMESEKLFREETVHLREKVFNFENELSKAINTRQQVETELVTLKTDNEIMKMESLKELQTLKATISTMQEELESTIQQLSTVQNQLSVERAASEAERRRANHLHEVLKERSATGHLQEMQMSGESSPTLSLGRVSISESLNSAIWPLDDPLDCNSSGREGSIIYEPFRGHSTTLLESLQSTLKQRDGEVHQMNYEVTRLTAERTALQAEITNLTLQVEANMEQLEQGKDILSQLNELQRQYDALLQMYGEKMEENEELKLDLEDVKAMYRVQIDELLLGKEKS